MISFWGVEHGGASRATPVSKTWLGPGKGWKPITKIPKYEAQYVGHSAKAKVHHSRAGGLTKGDRDIKSLFKERDKAIRAFPKEQMNKVTVDPVATMFAGSQATTVRVGGAKRGKSIVTGVADSKKNADYLLRHETQHAKVKRSDYRLQQIQADPKRLFREEARADYPSQGHYKKASSKGVDSGSTYSHMASARRREMRRPRYRDPVFGTSYKQQKTALAGRINAAFPHYNLSDDKKINQAADAYRSLQNRLAARDPKVRAQKKALLERKRS